MQKARKVLVRAADGRSRELALLRVVGQTAYVCPIERYGEALDDPDIAVGFPIEDVRSLENAD